MTTYMLLLVLAMATWSSSSISTVYATESSSSTSEGHTLTISPSVLHSYLHSSDADPDVARFLERSALRSENAELDQLERGNLAFDSEGNDVLLQTNHATGRTIDDDIEAALARRMRQKWRAEAYYENDQAKHDPTLQPILLEMEADVDSDVDAEGETELEAEAETENEAQAQNEVEQDSETEGQADTDTDAGAEAVAEATAEVEAAMKEDSEADAEAEADPTAEEGDAALIQLGAAMHADAESQSEAESESESLSGLEADEALLADAWDAAGLGLGDLGDAAFQQLAPKHVDDFNRELQQSLGLDASSTQESEEPLAMVELDSAFAFSPEDAQAHLGQVGRIRSRRLRAARMARDRNVVSNAAKNNPRAAEDPDNFGEYDERRSVEEAKPLDDSTVEGLKAERTLRLGSVRAVGMAPAPFCASYPFCKQTPSPPSVAGLPTPEDPQVLKDEMSRLDPQVFLPKRLADLKKDPRRFGEIFQAIYAENIQNEPLKNPMKKD